MRRVLRQLLPSVLLALISCTAALAQSCPTNYAQILANSIGADQPLATGLLIVYATDASEARSDYTIPLVGIGLKQTRTDPVVNGAITRPLCLPRSDRTYPAIGYHFIVKDTTPGSGGVAVIDISDVAITSNTFDLDAYQFTSGSPYALNANTYAGLAGAPVLPTGTIDGNNVTFTVPGAPASGLLFRNGILQALNVDYSYLNGTITYTVAPVPGDIQTFVGVTLTNPTTSSGSSSGGGSTPTVSGSLPITDSGTAPSTWQIVTIDGQLTVEPYTVASGAAAPPTSYSITDTDGQTQTLKVVNGQLFY